MQLEKKIKFNFAFNFAISKFCSLNNHNFFCEQNFRSPHASRSILFEFLDDIFGTESGNLVNF